jgi:hypothetical protein
MVWPQLKSMLAGEVIRKDRWHGDNVGPQVATSIQAIAIGNIKYCCDDNHERPSSISRTEVWRVLNRNLRCVDATTSSPSSMWSLDSIRDSRWA